MALSTVPPEAFMIVGDRLLAKLHDKSGNFTIFEVPESCPADYDEIQKQGTQIASKRKGEPYKRISGEVVRSFKVYDQIKSIEPADPDTEAPPLIFFKNNQVHTAPPGEYPAFFVLRDVPCGTCGAMIPMKAAVSTDTKNRFANIQANKPLDGLAEYGPVKRNGPKKWRCAHCLGKAPAPAPEPSPEEINNEKGENPDENSVNNSSINDLQQDFSPAPLQDHSPVLAEKSESAAPEPPAPVGSTTAPELEPPAAAADPVKGLLQDLELVSVNSMYSDKFAKGAARAAIRILRPRG